MDYIKVAGILALMPWICQTVTIPTIPLVPVYPGTSASTSTTTSTSSSTTSGASTTESGFKPITPLIKVSKSKTNLTNRNDEPPVEQGRSVISASDFTFDEDVQTILNSATEETPKRIASGYDDDDEDEEEDEYESPPTRPYRRRRPYGGLLSAMANKLYGSHSQPQSYIAYANPYGSFVKKRPGRPRDKYYQHGGYGTKPYTEHYKFYNPYGGRYKRPPKRYSNSYYGLPIGGVYKDPWYTGMHRRPGRPYGNYDRYSGYRRHSKPPKFHKWKDHKEGDQEQSAGHIVESYDDHDDDKQVIVEEAHEPHPHPPPKHGYEKVMGPPPPEIMEKINKLYKKPCYMPHCEHYKKGFIKFSYKKIVFPKKVKIIPIKTKKPKVKPVIVYEPPPEPVKYSPPQKVKYTVAEPPVKYSPPPTVIEEYPSHSVDFQVPYGVGGFEYTPSYPTKEIQPYIPEFSKAPVEVPYQPTYIPTDYGGHAHAVSYDDGKHGSYSNPVAHVQSPSQTVQPVPTSGYDSASLQQQAYASNTYSYDGNQGVNAYAAPTHGGASYGAYDTGTYGNTYGATDYGTGTYSSKSTKVSEGASQNDRGGKVYFNSNSNGKPSHSTYSASTAHETYIVKPSSSNIAGTGYVKELEGRPTTSYNQKKFNALKSFYMDEAKYDKGPPKDPYGPTYMLQHDPSETYPYERSDKAKVHKKKN